MNERTIEEQYLINMVLPLVDKYDAIKVTRIVDDQGILLTLYVDATDIGKVIGKSGVTAQALRQLLRAYGGSQKKSISMKIHDPKNLLGNDL